ncbi:hypothetical protein LX36DRAFT_433981 [Colletotrichum falcatum]|nr:hypothetical protein LX36DRAFT_433981 [Colletotrichum falcatum]
MLTILLKSRTEEGHASDQRVMQALSSQRTNERGGRRSNADADATVCCGGNLTTVCLPSPLRVLHIVIQSRTDKKFRKRTGQHLPSSTKLQVRSRSPTTLGRHCNGCLSRGQLWRSFVAAILQVQTPVRHDRFCFDGCAILAQQLTLDFGFCFEWLRAHVVAANRQKRNKKGKKMEKRTNGPKFNQKYGDT